MSRCLLSLAYGDWYGLMSEKMAESFLRYNSGWNVERICEGAIRVPVNCTRNGMTAYNICESGKWVMMREMLDKYDEVLYCDNDVYWYGEYGLLDADVVLVPNWITGNEKYRNSRSLRYLGIYNSGIVYVKGDGGRRTCDFMIEEINNHPDYILWDKQNAGFEFSGMCWITRCMNCLAEIGINCIINNDPGANLTEWNLKCGDRNVVEDSGSYLVNCGGSVRPLQSVRFHSNISVGFLDLEGTAARMAGEYISLQKQAELEMWKKRSNMVICMRNENGRTGLLDLVERNFSGKSGLTMIEIGSYQGESTEIFLSSGKFDKIYCIDAWTNGYDDTDIASFHVNLAEKSFDSRFENDDRIVKIKGFSYDVADSIPDGVADLLYVDGCHLAEAVKKDLEMYASKVKNGGVLAGHDYGPEYQFKGLMDAVDGFLGHEPENRYCDFRWSNKK